MSNKVKNKTREFPHIFIVLFIILIVATIATYIIPAGRYERVLDEATGRQIIDPQSFTYIDRTPVNPFEMLLSMVEGFIDASNISILIFLAFSALYIVEKTGAMDAAISFMVRKTKKNPKTSTIAIILMIVIFGVWGSTGTLSFEEIIAFIPIFVTLSIALGYDALVGLGISFTAVGVGFSTATVNPFTIGVAQGISKLPLFSGLGFRIVILAVFLLLTIAYILWYANKVKKDPSKSLVSEVNFGDFEMDEDRMNTSFTPERKATMVVLFIGVAIMIVGLIKLGWYINQVSAIFLGIIIFTGIVNKWSPNFLAKEFVTGMSKAVLSAFTVGFARGILVIINKGNILDTIIYSAANLLNELPLYASAIGMLIFQTLLNFFIPSGSGQAAVSMPILAPLSDLIGLNRQIAVLIFQFGSGISDLVWPTGFVMIGCTASKIPVNKYYKWFLPLFLIMIAVQVISVFIAIAINYGPF